MPSRKDASAAQQAAGIDSFDLPKALVTRLAKSVLPPEVKLQKDTVTALVRGATVFINYLAATAQEIAETRSRRTIASADVLAALEVLELGDLVPLLQRELDGYRGEKENKEKASGDTKGKSKEVVRLDQQGREPDGDDAVDGGDDEDDAPDENHEPEAEAEPQDAEEEPALEEEEEEEVVEDMPLDADMPDADMPDADMPDADPHEEGDEIEDMVALEAEELRRDAHGLEDKDAAAGEDGE